jgi:hypothetical protein
MSKLVIMGTVEVAPGKMDQVGSLVMAHRVRCLKDEPGTLQFAGKARPYGARSPSLRQSARFRTH